MDDELKEFLEQKFTELREYTDERTHDMETKLLKAFRNWAVRVEAKMSVQRATTDGMSDRMNVLEQRVDDLEAKN
jgi:hypothetical protein